MAGEVIAGVGTGALSGAAIGTEILPGWGTAIGAVVGGVAGGISGANKKKANEMTLPLEDQTQIEIFNELKRKQKALEAGSTYQAQKDIINQAGYKTMESIVKITGGDVGATVAALSGAQKATGRSMNELFAEMSAEGLKLNVLMEGLVEKISNRKLQIQAYEKSQAMVAAAQQQQNLTNMAMAALANDSEENEENEFAKYIKGLFATKTGAGTGGSVPASALQSWNQPSIQEGGINMPVSGFGGQTTGWNSGLDLSLGQ